MIREDHPDDASVMAELVLADLITAGYRIVKVPNMPSGPVCPCTLHVVAGERIAQLCVCGHSNLSHGIRGCTADTWGGTR